MDAIAGRNVRRAGAIRLVVPTAVREEAGWDRRAGSAAPINRLRADEPALDRDTADLAAPVVAELGVSVADAHIATVVATTPGAHVALTSDPDDTGRVADRLRMPVRTVPI